MYRPAYLWKEQGVLNIAIIVISALLALGAAVNTAGPQVGAAATAAVATPAPTPTPAPAPMDVISGGGPSH
jgi:hypothetical protein